MVNKINNSEGSLGLLINDKELYNSLKDTSKVLEQLMKDIEEKGLLKILHTLFH